MMQSDTKNRKTMSITQPLMALMAVMVSGAGVLGAGTAVADDNLLPAKPCVITTAATSCSYTVNNAKALSAVSGAVKDKPEAKVTATLYKDMAGSKSFVWMVNLPGLNRNDSRDMRDHLIAMVKAGPKSATAGMFISDDKGLNVVAAPGSSAATLADKLADWKSPDTAQSAVEDLLSALKIAAANPADHKGFQWITSGITLSSQQASSIKAAVKAADIRFSILLLIQSESDINRFAPIKQLAADSQAYFVAKKQDGSANPLTGNLGFYRSGVTVNFASKGFCGPQALDISYKIGGKDFTRTEALAYPACPKKPEPVVVKKPADVPAQDAKDPADAKDDQKAPTAAPTADDQKAPTADDQKAPTADDQKLPTADDQTGDDQKAPTADDQKDPTADDQTGDPKADDQTPKPADDKPIGETEEKDNMLVYSAAAILALVLIGLLIFIMRRGKSAPQADIQRQDQAGGNGSLQGSITITGSGQSDRQIPLGGSSMRIGRADGNDIVVQDDSVSGFHGLLRAEAGGVITFTDLNSTNGSFMDNEQITSVQLTGGEHIRLGSTVLIYER